MNAAIFLLTATFATAASQPVPEAIAAPADAQTTPVNPGAPLPMGPAVPGGHGPVGPPMGSFPGAGYGGSNLGFTQSECLLCRWTSFFHGRFGSLLCRLRFWRPCGCSSCGETCGCCSSGCSTGMPPLAYLNTSPVPASSTAVMPVMIGETNSAAAPPRSLALANFTAPEVKTSGTSGKLVVALPAGARLFVADQPVKARAGETTFRTPLLGDEEIYYYDLRAELDRDGQTIRESTRVVVRPGQEAWVSFPRLEMTPAPGANSR